MSTIERFYIETRMLHVFVIKAISLFSIIYKNFKHLFSFILALKRIDFFSYQQSLLLFCHLFFQEWNKFNVLHICI